MESSQPTTLPSVPQSAPKKRKKGGTRIEDQLYYVGMVLAVIWLLMFRSLWLVIPHFVVASIRLMAMAFLFVRLLVVLTKLAKSKYIVLIGVMLLITFVAGLNSGNMFRTFVTISLVIGACGLPYRKIIKTYFFTGFFYCLATVLGSQIGLAENFTMIEADETRETVSDLSLRMGMGYGWATDFAAHVFYLIITFVFYKKGLLSLTHYLILLPMIYFVLHVTDSRFCAICSLTTLVASLVYKFIYKKRKRIKRLFLYGSIVLTPVLAYISYWATNAYNPADLKWIVIDMFFTNRLRYGNEALNYPGLNLFGNKIIMGGTGFFKDQNNYFDIYYIDNSYLQYAVLYGLLFLAVIIISYMVLSWKMVRRGNLLLIMCICITAFQGVVDQQFLDVGYNPFLIALLAKHNYKYNILVK